jgi:hypothetical protein
LLLVGFSTRKEHDSEILDQVRSATRSLVDLDRYRKLIRERVIPAPREVTVEWVSCGEGKGVLVIDVPTQPPARLPHVVAGPGRSGDAGRVSVAVPVREADATVWLPQAEIQRLLAAGWTATGGPSEESLSGLIRQAVSAAQRESPAPQPGAGIGEGEPGGKGCITRRGMTLMSRRIWIGTPVSAVLWTVPVWSSILNRSRRCSAGFCALCRTGARWRWPERSGRRSRQPLRAPSAGIRPQARRARTRDAIVYMAQNFGFLDATEDRLQPAESRDSAD